MRTKLLLIAATTLLLCSCGTLKKHSKTEKTETKTEEVAHSVETKTVTEQADTSVVVPGSTIEDNGWMVDLEKGDTLKAENEDQIIEVHFDKKTGKVQAVAVSKPKVVALKFKRSAISQTVIDSKQKKAVKTEVVEKEKERTSGATGFIIGGVCSLLFLLIIYLIYRYFKSKIPV